MIVTTVILGACLVLQDSPPDEPATQWYRGNTHTHTLWSDGDAPPDHVVGWYVDHGYQFLVLSDHNVMQQGEKWFPITEDGRLTPDKVRIVTEAFGPDHVEIREQDGTRELRLKNLDDLKGRFETPGSFLLIPGEEVTDRFRMAEVHINALNIEETIPPQGGEGVQETIQNNLDAISAHGTERGRSVLAHLNHPNFRTSLGVTNLAAMRGERFFEVYNGHRSVDNEGAVAEHSTESLWDQALVLRLHEGAGDGEILYGLASDDAHDHYEVDAVSVPGRGWVMVRSNSLDADAIIDAMKRGDFYASSGVGLDEITCDEETLEIAINAEPGLTYTTEFIGVGESTPGVRPTAEVLMATTENPARYRFTGNELYVRARITSSRAHPRPYAEGDREQAWVQPVRPTKPTTVEPATTTP
ncbi:MAG: histidinol-phosphatase [Planctomycetota bacterium]|nr:histidinol-phosphatase [Planctomycetota bacterium]